jgi:hypothetical protein
MVFLPAHLKENAVPDKDVGPDSSGLPAFGASFALKKRHAPAELDYPGPRSLARHTPILHGLKLDRTQLRKAERGDKIPWGALPPPVARGTGLYAPSPSSPRLRMGSEPVPQLAPSVLHVEVPLNPVTPPPHLETKEYLVRLRESGGERSASTLLRRPQSSPRLHPRGRVSPILGGSEFSDAFAPPPYRSFARVHSRQLISVGSADLIPRSPLECEARAELSRRLPLPPVKPSFAGIWPSGNPCGSRGRSSPHALPPSLPQPSGGDTTLFVDGIGRREAQESAIELAISALDAARPCGAYSYVMS